MEWCRLWILVANKKPHSFWTRLCLEYLGKLLQSLNLDFTPPAYPTASSSRDEFEPGILPPPVHSREPNLRFLNPHQKPQVPPDAPSLNEDHELPHFSQNTPFYSPKAIYLQKWRFFKIRTSQQSSIMHGEFPNQQGILLLNPKICHPVSWN